jgi:hypothetical protein
MAVYLKILPGLKVRLGKRGVRVGIGPRIARGWLGAGGPGVSSGAGPVSAHRGLRRRRRRR